MDTQFKKGVLELCVLSVLQKHDCYGYELVKQISEKIVVSEGTIYPLLRRLKNDEYVETYLVESTGGPSRKYYKLTASGKTVQSALETEWSEFSASVNSLLKELYDV